MEYSLLAALWIFWCVLHSALVSKTVTGYLKERMGEGFRFYRLIYCLFSGVTLAPVIFYMDTVQSPTVFHWNGYLLIVKYLLVAAALFLFIAGGWRYDMLRFIGIRQVMEPPAGQQTQIESRLEVDGILRVTRHPWYLGGIIALWPGDLSTAGFITSLILSGYFIIGTYLEEVKLIDEFGDEYRDYQRNVSMLFPFKWLKNRLTSTSPS